MFGEDGLYGSFSCKLDDKNRIILPASTKAEKGEKLIAIKNNTTPRSFDLYKKEIIEERIEKIDQLILETTDEEHRQKLEQLRKDICVAIIRQITVSSERRIADHGIYEELGTVPKVIYGIGEYNRIRFFAEKKDFDDYRSKELIKK